LNWTQFIKKLLSLDVIFGARTKKLSGIPDHHKFFRGLGYCDGSKIYLTDVVPSWIKEGTKVKINGSLNDGITFIVLSVSAFHIESSTILNPFPEDLFELDGRLSTFYTEDIARDSTQGTMFNVNRKGSGISSAQTNHYHKIQDLFDHRFDSPEVLGKLLISDKDHTILVDKDGNPLYVFPDR